MAIIIRHRVPLKRNHRREQFDAAIRELAPAIASVRAEGYVGIEDIMKRLNDDGITAPNGGRFTLGAMHRVLTRLGQLGLGPGPRSVSGALSDRWTRKAEAGEALALAIDKRQSAKTAR